jgi:hypothetical protein
MAFLAGIEAAFAIAEHTTWTPLSLERSKAMQPDPGSLISELLILIQPPQQLSISAEETRAEQESWDPAFDWRSDATGFWK